MKARERFRAVLPLKLRDKDAADTPLRNGDAKDLSKDEIKQREREQTEELTGKIAHLQQMLFAQRKHKVLLVLQGCLLYTSPSPRD